jgi:hypothetical protein
MLKRSHVFIFGLALTIAACAGGGSTKAQVEPPLPNASQWQGVDCDKILDYPQAEYERSSQCEAAQLPPLDPARREYFGGEYSPRKYLECKLRSAKNNTDCDIYKLRRAENPEYWPYPDAPKPKWPEAPKESVYKTGMNSKQYFEALCKAEAGEFIYKTVENVEGIYQIRPLTRLEDQNDDLYITEASYGIGYTDTQMVAVDYLKRDGYLFFESPIKQMPINNKLPNKVERIYSSRSHNLKSGESEYSERPKSRYAFTWRGIQRPHDRGLEVAGEELVVIDLQTNEILAVRRSFRRRDYIPHTQPTRSWGADHCPNYELAYKFVEKVAKPLKAEASK